MPDLKEIKIFLASSIVEFDRERDELQTYITRLNKEYMPRGIYFDLEVCENVSNALAATRKQDEYNDIIRASRYVYLLVGERIGQYTEEEFDVALEQFRETGAPFIYTYFKRMPDGGTSQDQSVLSFMQRLGDGIGHYWSEYTDLDSIKLNIILELMRDPEVGGVVQFEDGRALLNGEEMVSLENVPIYSGNDNLQELRVELSRLEERCVDLKAVMSQCFDEDATLEYAEVAKRRSEVAEQVRNAEMAVLENMNLIVSKSRSGKEIDPRERRAAELTNEGKYAEANAVLQDRQWDEEMVSATEIAEGLREKARQYISGKRALAANLKSMGINSETEPKVIDAYSRAYEIAKGWCIEPSVLYDYASFMRDQLHTKEALGIAEELVCLLRIQDSADNMTMARALDLRGRLQHSRRLYDCEILSYNEAFSFLGNPTNEDTEAILLYAILQSHMAAYYWKKKQYPQAKECLDIAISIMEEMDDKESLEELGFAYNLAGIITNGMNKLKESEAYHFKAVAVRETLARTGLPERVQDLKVSYHNLGFLYAKMKRYVDAGVYYEKAVGLLEELADNNPAAFEGSLATTLIQLGKTYRREHRFEEAEIQVARGLKIRRNIFSRDRDRMAPGLSIGLKELAVVIREAGWKNRFSEAEIMLSEAYNLRKQLSLEGDKSLEVDQSTICQEYARLLWLMGDKAKAGSLFEEALTLRRPWFEKDNSRHGAMYSEICHWYALFLHEQSDDQIAEPLAQEAFAIRKKLYSDYPEIYEQEYCETQELLNEIQRVQKCSGCG